MKFIHISDVLLGAGAPSGKPDRGYAQTWDEFYRILDIADQERVDLIIISGNLFSRRPLRSELDELNDRFRKLKTARVAAIAGARDYISSGSPYKAYEWSNNVSFFRKDHLSYMYLEDINTIVYGMSYADPDMNKPVYDRLVPLTHFADGKSVPSDCRHILIAFGGDGKHIPIDLARLRSANFDYAAIGGRLRPWMDKNAPIAYAGSLVSFDDDTVNHGYIMGTIDEEGTMIDLMPLTQEDEEGTRIAEESEEPEPEKKDQGITVGSPDDDAVTDYLQEIQKLEYENSGTGIRNAAIVFPFFGAALVLYAAQNLLPFDGIMTVVICIILAAVGIIVLIPLARARGRRKRQIRYLKKRYRMSRDDAEVIDDRIRG